MTVMTIAARPVPALSERILSAFDALPARRPAIASELLAELLATPRLTVASTVVIWSLMADLLDRCADDCSFGDVEQLARYAGQSEQARKIAEATRQMIEVRKPGRRAQSVIEAVCAEVVA